MQALIKPQEEAEFEISDLMGIVMTFVVLGIGLTYGLSVMGDVKADTDRYDCPYTYQFNPSYNSTYCYPTNETYNVNHTIANLGETAAYTASTQALTGVGKFGTKLGLIVTVVIAAVIIGILVRYLWMK